MKPTNAKLRSLCFVLLATLVLCGITTAMALDTQPADATGEGVSSPVLDAETETQLRTDYLQMLREDDIYSAEDFTLEDILIVGYYGHYNGCEVVQMDTVDAVHDDGMCEVEIAGHIFTFGSHTSSGLLFAYRDAQFTHLKDAYESGMVTAEDIHQIAVIRGDYPYSFTILAQAVKGGAISPADEVAVDQDESQTFTITPYAGYLLTDVLVDGESVGPVTTYTFEAVNANHTIEAKFIVDMDKFTDLDSTQWYMDAVQFVVNEDLFQGVSDTEFAPDGQMSRAMFVQVLYNLSEQVDRESVATEYLNPFDDVPSDEWFTEAVSWAAGSGLVEGYSPSTFAPDDSITREQMAKLLSVYADHMGLTLETGGNTEFTDSARVSDWAGTYVTRITGAGLMRGHTDGSFSPQGLATRAEVATVFQNLLEKYM